MFFAAAVDSKAPAQHHASQRLLSFHSQRRSPRHSLHESCHNDLNRNHASTAFATRHAATLRASSHLAANKRSGIYSSQRILPLEKPADPSSFSSSNVNNNCLNNHNDINEMSYVQTQAQMLRQWMSGKQAVVCLTGAGMSTESGIPDYRGHKGSYFRGHKPIIHLEYMSSEQQRKRYWARSLIGYSPFANAQPNQGHYALAKLEEMGRIGVELGKCTDFDCLGDSCFGNLDRQKKRISIVTQNVDTLHSAAGVQHCLHLHGRGDLVKCMSCGRTRDRKDYHNQLMQWNRDWFDEVTSVDDTKYKGELRPDGDAELGRVSYDELILPHCSSCEMNSSDHHCNSTANGNYQKQEHQSFFKTDVVFFGDSVPKHRFNISHAAIDASDGILCIGTSLAVHSAFRLVKRAMKRGTPVAIVNVGKTRVEREGLGAGLITKLESPIGETLAELVKILNQEEYTAPGARKTMLKE